MMSRVNTKERFEIPPKLAKALDSEAVKEAARCLTRVYDFIIQKGDRNQFAEIQASIECSFYGLTQDRRRSTYNMIDRYKIIIYFTNFLNFNVNDDRTRDVLFNFVFLSANKDSPAYQQRMGFLATACELCVEYPAKKLLDCTATWLLQDLPTQLEGEMIVQRILDSFVFAKNKNLVKHVENLRETALQFCVILFFYSITERNFNKPERATLLVSVISKWLVFRTNEFTDTIRKSKILSSQFSLIKLPILVKYCCTNSVDDDDHNRFEIGILKLIDTARKIFFPLNFGFMKSIDVKKLDLVAVERFEECAYTFVNWSLITKEELPLDVQEKISTKD